MVTRERRRQDGLGLLSHLLSSSLPVTLGDSGYTPIQRPSSSRVEKNRRLSFCLLISLSVLGWAFILLLKKRNHYHGSVTRYLARSCRGFREMDHGQRNDIIILCFRNIPYLAGSTPEPRPRADKVFNSGESPRTCGEGILVRLSTRESGDKSFRSHRSESIALYAPYV